ncbi:MAG: hypothetical protein LQ342_000720 [Letrouitia transgressa]|nr:MAG: hypothetical protein LQ342_000720 [Letrouitia transgressa]
MEERKRPATYEQDESGPPLKRQATLVNGATKAHSDADIPWQDDLERFQKEAIWRQMQEYKRQVSVLTAEIQTRAAREHFHDDHIRTMMSWFDQVIDEIKILVNHEDSLSSFAPFPSTLLSADNSLFQEHLKAKSKEINGAIPTLLAKATPSNPEVSELQGRLAQQLATNKVYLKTIDSLKLQLQQKEDQLDNASYRYMMAEKKLDRSKSATIAKLEAQALAGGRSETGSGLGGGKERTDSEQPNVKVEDGEGLFEAQKAQRDAVATLEKHKEQLQELEADNEKLTTQLTELSTRQTQVSDEDYSRTDLFKHLKSQHEDVIKRVNNLEALNVQLREEAQKLQAERSAYRIELENESQAAIAEKDTQIAQVENDIARIRTGRDELLADQAMRKAVQNQERTSMNQLKELTSSQEERIKAFESEVQRLKHQHLGPDSAYSPQAELENLPLDELRIKYVTMEKQLNKELQSMIAAYTKSSALASQKVGNLTALEDKVVRLQAEKSKADQKYFGAMKAKEAREQEVRTLRAQNSKSSDIISQLKEADAASKAYSSNLEKQLTEQKDTASNLLKQLQAAQQQIAELNISIQGLKSQQEELKKLLAAKESAANLVKSTYRKSEVEIESLKVRLDETEKALRSWKTKGQSNPSAEEESFRTLVICTVCRDNFKDTVIKTCGHIFCKDCVEERRTSRSRKCPNCNKSFGQGDTLHVTL